MEKNGAVAKSINSISMRITGLCDRVENIKGKLPECIAVIVYLVFRMLMSLVHEPWFDEALAWLIARDSSLYEIFFVAPHYEGHPSLWHLVLMPFAKLGAPYELSMNLVSLIFSGIAMALFIYKAPFKRIIRLLAPYTYFLFYQYSVVNRPYCMMMLAFVLVAITYGKRNERPGHFVLSLWFLCVTGAYGVVVAGGICIVWLIEMLNQAKSASKNKNFENGECRGTFRIFIEDGILSKGKLFCLLGLLAYALFIIYRIVPAEDAFAILKSDGESVMTFPLRLLYVAFGMASDLFVTNTYSYGITISESGLGLLDILPAVLLGIAILSAVFIMAKRKRLLMLFVLPYGMLVVSMSYLYMSRHHMGIALMYLIFFMWVYLEKGEKEKVKAPEKKEVSKLKITKELKTSLTTIAIAFGMVISLYWSISSTVVDVIFDYALGRDEYVALEEKGLVDKTILAEWSSMPNNGDEAISPITFSGVVTTLLPYMDADTFLNSPNKAGYNYSLIHKVPSVEVTEKLIDRIQQDALPDIIIGEPDYSKIYRSGMLDKGDYIVIYEGEGGLIWKGVPEMTGEKIYVRKELKSEP